MDPTGYLDQELNTFDGVMVIVLFLQITIMILDRYISRSDTKIAKKKS